MFEEERNESNNEEHKNLVTLCYSNKILGIACYNELNNTISADAINVSVEDMEDILRNIKINIKPSLFILHPKILTNQSLLELVTCGLDGEPDAIRYHTLKSSCWNTSKCTSLIYSSLMVRSPSHQQYNIYHLLASVYDMENPSLCQAIGALISFMQEKVFNMDDGKVVVSALKQVQLDTFMRLDAATIRSLQIFTEDIHPNVIKGKGRSKEGFSVFGLFDRTHSLPGRQKLKEWMSNPFYDKHRILQRQKGVALVVRQSNRDFIKNISSLLRHFYDIPRLILRVKKVEATYSDWSKIHSSLVICVKIMEHFRIFVGSNSGIVGADNNITGGDIADDISYISELLEPIDNNLLRNLITIMEQGVDFEESEAAGSIVIKDGHDAILDQQRTVFDNLDTYLIKAGHDLLQMVPHLQDISVDYVPQIGFLVAIKEEELHKLNAQNANVTAAPTTEQTHNNIWGDNSSDYLSNNAIGSRSNIESNSFEFIYAQDGMHYFKHSIVEKLDDSLGDIKSDIVDRQRLLMLQIEDAVLDGEAQLQQVSLAVSSFDAIISLGVIAIERKLTAPTISEEPAVVIKGGRHLLQEMTVDNFVPNDGFLSSEKNVGLITGPNNSGKSVYLKQVGLIVYLAHIGSYVPCDRAIIGLTDRIMSRISSVETVSAPQSAFTLDLQQVARMLKSQTKASLCLVDEFGKGTTPIDGIALLAAVVKHFSSVGGLALLVLHFTEILHDEILTPHDLQSINCYRMEIHHPPKMVDTEFDTGNTTEKSTNRNQNSGVQQWDDSVDWEECMPLYKLSVGVAPCSEGFACAKSAGIAQNVVRRATTIKKSVSERRCIPVQSTRGNSIVNDSKKCTLLEIFLRHQNWVDPKDTALDEDLTKFKAAL